ncbi:FAD-dependent oxidoreductase [Catenulispora yoronensis]
MAAGLDVRLGSVVTAVHQDAAGVRIRTEDGGAFEADRAVVAVPPVLADGIDFAPGCPPPAPPPARPRAAR